MTHSTLPDNWQELLAGYVLGDLEAAETAEVERWLTTYPEVAAELTALQTTWESLPAILPRQTPPPQLRDRVMSSRPGQVAPAAPRPARARPLSWVFGVGWAVTAIALAAVVTENQRLREAQLQSEAIVASLTNTQNRLVALSGTAEAPDAEGLLAIDSEAQAALIATQSLAPLPEDEVYRLWAVANETPTYCGEFNPNQDEAIAQWGLPDSACSASSALLLITREQADAPRSPQGELVLQPQS